MPRDSWTDFDRAAAMRDGAAAAEAFGVPMPKDVSGRTGGDIGGMGTGSSIDFHDQRTYVPGDDPRHINWGAFARTGSYTMKLFREEVQPMIDIVVDTSASMGYLPEKAERTVSVLTFLAHAARKAQASTWFYEANPADGKASARWSAEDVLAGRWPDTAGAATTAPPSIHTIPLRQRSIRVLVSDLLFPGDPAALLKPFGRAAGAASLLAPYLPGEADPDWEGGCDFEDAEGEARLPTWCDRGLIDRYRDAYRTHFASWAEASGRAQVAFARVPAGGRLLEAFQVEALRSGAVSPSR